MGRKKEVIIEEEQEEYDEQEDEDEEEQEEQEEYDEEFDEDDIEYNYKEYDDEDGEDNKEDEEEDFDTLISDLKSLKKEEKSPEIIVPKEERISKKKLTKFEKCRLILIRTDQLIKGAPTNIRNTLNKSYIEIAMEELETKKLFLKIRRIMPDNKIEIWDIDELETQLEENEKIRLRNIGPLI